MRVNTHGKSKPLRLWWRDCLFQNVIFQSNIAKPPVEAEMKKGKGVPKGVPSGPSLGFCYQPHLQDTDWSDAVWVLLQSSSHSSSTQLPPLEVRTKSMELKQITSVGKRGKHFLVLFFWDVQMLWQAALVRKHQKCNCINRIAFLGMWKWRWCVIYKWMMYHFISEWRLNTGNCWTA